MPNKNIFLIAAVVISVLSCKKDKNNEPPPAPAYVDPYALPWKTEFISYNTVNPPDCGGSHSYGYRIFYKDTLLRSLCGDWTSYRKTGGSLIVNDSIMHIYIFGDRVGEVLSTRNGGYSWTEKKAGGETLLTFHSINLNLVYCVTGFNTNFYTITGIGKSDVSAYQFLQNKGRIYVSDHGAGISDRDSTVITVNDSLSIVVKFK